MHHSLTGHCKGFCRSRSRICALVLGPPDRRKPAAAALEADWDRPLQIHPDVLGLELNPNLGPGELHVV